MAQLIKLPITECLRCGHRWVGKMPPGSELKNVKGRFVTVEVRVCANCRSPYFDKAARYKHPNPKMAMQRKEEAKRRAAARQEEQ